MCPTFKRSVVFFDKKKKQIAIKYNGDSNMWNSHFSFLFKGKHIFWSILYRNFRLLMCVLIFFSNNFQNCHTHPTQHLIEAHSDYHCAYKNLRCRNYTFSTVIYNFDKILQFWQTCLSIFDIKNFIILIWLFDKAVK